MALLVAPAASVEPGGYQGAASGESDGDLPATGADDADAADGSVAVGGVHGGVEADNGFDFDIAPSCGDHGAALADKTGEERISGASSKPKPSVSTAAGGNIVSIAAGGSSFGLSNQV